MSLVHDHPEFADLVRIVARDCGLSHGLVEKDYWVTHTLWALHDQGFEIWFKGGTSLSKGFGLIERFSEDLDLKIEPGAVAAVPRVDNWKSEGKIATAARREYFQALAEAIAVPGAIVEPDLDRDPTARSAEFRVVYRGHHHDDLAPVFKPFVLLEVGSARVSPFVARDLTSFVHDHLVELGEMASFNDNRPRAVRCVHPLVTLLEKLDAIQRRLPRDTTHPATFVRHFEDAARIIDAAPLLPALHGYASPLALAEDMLAQRQVAARATAADPAFTPSSSSRWDEVRRAHEAIAPMFWGPRITLDEACAAIRSWVETTLASD